jgi:hypothetical protein
MSPEVPGVTLTPGGVTAPLPAQSGGSATAARFTACEPCANCGARVSGNYCSACGQRRAHALHSLRHFLSEAIEDLTHADSRLWRTLGALTVKPGLLTREFLDGRRVRYLPPLRLYLVLSVMFFVVTSLEQGHRPLQEVNLARSPGLPSLQALPGESEQQREARVCNPDYDGPGRSFVQPFLVKGCQHFLTEQGQREVREAFLHNAPRALFLFLPVLALVMKPLYWRPRRYYIEHLLFFLHSHSFAFLLLTLLTLAELLSATLAVPLKILALLYLPYYLFVAMRRVYGQSRARTLLKLTALAGAYLCGVIVLLVMLSMYSIYVV